MKLSVKTLLLVVSLISGFGVRFTFAEVGPAVETQIPIIDDNGMLKPVDSPVVALDVQGNQINEGKLVTKEQSDADSQKAADTIDIAADAITVE